MKKAAGILGLILVVVFLVLGFTTSTPDKYIKSYGDGKMYEYVGGDAYNFIIEASLRGGEIAGAITSKAIYFSAAGILLVLSISFLCSDEGIYVLRGEISDAKNSVRNVEIATRKISEALEENQKKQDTALNKIIEQQAASLPQESKPCDDDPKESE